MMSFPKLRKNLYLNTLDIPKTLKPKKIVIMIVRIYFKATRQLVFFSERKGSV